MHRLSSSHGPRVDGETRMERAAPGAPVRACAPPACASAEEFAASLAAGVMPEGVRR